MLLFLLSAHSCAPESTRTDEQQRQGDKRGSGLLRWRWPAAGSAREVGQPAVASTWWGIIGAAACRRLDEEYSNERRAQLLHKQTEVELSSSRASRMRDRHWLWLCYGLCVAGWVLSTKIRGPMSQGPATSAAGPVVLFSHCV